jgi:dienelactone hydrolase
MIVLVVVLLLWLAALRGTPETDAYDANLCAGPPLQSVLARNDAMEAGYAIHPRYGCIDKASFDAVNAQQAAWQQAHEQSLARERRQLAEDGAKGFAQARHGFETAIKIPGGDAPPLPQPPAALFVRSDYKNPRNYRLPGYVTPDPRDGRRHPAILWLTGGDTNALGDFWTPGPDAKDQTARAFREAGLIMVFPTLRGGHGQGGAKEWLLGEVGDVLAAAEQTVRLSYVDPERIYLGGHSTGGTLALLVAAMPTPFKAVFAFGPVATADRYAPGLIPVDFSAYDPMELKLRSPLHWLGDIGQPTYIVEGVDGSGNRTELETLCAATRNPLVHCLPVQGADHFSVLRRATQVIATQLAAGPADGTPTLTPEALVPCKSGCAGRLPSAAPYETP